VRGATTTIDWLTIDTAPQDGRVLLLYVPTARQPFQVGHYMDQEHREYGLVTYGHQKVVDPGWREPTNYALLDKPA
jgi:hypothetical protein